MMQAVNNEHDLEPNCGASCVKSIKSTLRSKFNGVSVRLIGRSVQACSLRPVRSILRPS